MAREAREVIPEGRCGVHTEIAGPVMMLATSAGSYMNGQIITVDGAWTLVSSDLGEVPSDH
jgi:NAD(P)-dependent dehydrogenase (short-subunit alcohol dehydrogenase family)